MYFPHAIIQKFLLLQSRLFDYYCRAIVIDYILIIAPNIEGQGVGLPSGSKKDMVPRSVITLKWCTPKSSSSTGMVLNY